MSAPVVLFNGTYDETMALLVEARNYVAFREAVDRKNLAPMARLQACFESLRVTSRLTQIMAWLLAQKAVYAGEISAEQGVGEAYALSGGGVCDECSGADNEDLPCGLRSLLERSYRLYRRVVRLEDMVRRHVLESGAETDHYPAVVGMVCGGGLARLGEPR
ncbi:regulator of CtrA degradation [uncultured Gammaproteobacteria bacterium]